MRMETFIRKALQLKAHHVVKVEEPTPGDLLVTALGGAIGLGLAALTSLGMAQAVAQFFPVLGMPSSTWAIGVVLVVVLGGIAAALPSAQAAQLKIVDALRKV